MILPFFYLNFNINQRVIEYKNCQQSLLRSCYSSALYHLSVALNEILRDTFSAWPALQWGGGCAFEKFSFSGNIALRCDMESASKLSNRLSLCPCSCIECPEMR